MRHAVLDIFDGPHCGLCRTADRAGRAYLQGIMNDGVNDPAQRTRWRNGGGLCPEHWRVWRSLDTSALPSAIVCRDLLAHRLADGSGNGQAVCPACEAAGRAERTAQQALDRLRWPQVADALTGAPGFLCLGHLGRLRDQAMAGHFQTRLNTLLTELDAFIRVNDYRFAHEPKGGEQDSWLRAIRALGGRV